MEDVNTSGEGEEAPRICLATVTDERCALAAEVLLFSFLRFNPWFQGDIVVVAAGPLSERSKQRLQALYPLRFIQASPALRQRTQALEQAIPWLRRKRAHFHVFELFALAEYQHLVYIDADAYCCGDIAELFYRQEPLLACPDAFTLRAQLWQRLGRLAPEALPQVQPYGVDVSRSFNSGVLSINAPLLGKATFEALLELLTPEVFKDAEFGDQMALNVFFRGQFSALSARYNYMVLIEEYLKGLENLTSLDARIVHFAGKLKPWFNFDIKELQNKAPHYIKYFDSWRELLCALRKQDDLAHIAAQVAKQRAWSRQQLPELDIDSIESLSG